jgi:hypothetical protein
VQVATRSPPMRPHAPPPSSRAGSEAGRAHLLRSRALTVRGGRRTGDSELERSREIASEGSRIPSWIARDIIWRVYWIAVFRLFSLLLQI